MIYRVYTRDPLSRRIEESIPLPDYRTALEYLKAQRYEYPDKTHWIRKHRTWGDNALWWDIGLLALIVAAVWLWALWP